jgi:hypothetical protein
MNSFGEKKIKTERRQEPAMFNILPKEATQDFFCRQHRPWDSAVNEMNSFVARMEKNQPRWKSKISSANNTGRGIVL